MGATELDLMKAYANDLGLPADAMDAVLTNVSDAKSIPIRIYGGALARSGEARQVLDVQAVEVENFMGTRGRRIEVSPGVTLIYGGNAVGKTTLQKAMLYALAGPTAAGVKTAEELMRHGTESMSVTLAFAGGHVTRGCDRRIAKKGKDAGKLLVDHTLAAQIDGEKANKPREAQATLDSWLGVDAAFVRRVACLEQGQLTEIMDEQPARRRELFYRLLSLEPCEDTRAALAKVLDEEENGIVLRTRALQQCELEMEALKKKRAGYPIDQLMAKRDELRPVVAASATNPTALKQARELFEQLSLQRTQNQLNATRAREYRAKIDELQRDPTLAMVYADITPDLEKAQFGARRAMEAHAQLAAELTLLTAKGTDIKQLPPVCPMCAKVGRTCDLTDDVKQKMLAEVRIVWIEKSRAVADALAQLNSAKAHADDVARMRDAALKNASHQAYVREQVALLTSALAQLPPDADLGDINARLEQAASTVKALEAAGTPAAADDLRIVERALAEAAALDQQIAAVHGRANAAREAVGAMSDEDLQAFRQVVHAFSKQGIPMWLARKHLERVNAIAGELVGVDRFRYSFGPELEILVRDADVVIPPQLASGSARQRGAVVLMAALGRYLQELSGLSIPFLWIDELPYQDDVNIGLVIDMVKKLTRWYPKVVLCASRWEELTGQFDHEIALQPEDVSLELDRQRQARAKLAASGQAQLAPPPPPVKTYGFTEERLVQDVVEQRPGVPDVQGVSAFVPALSMETVVGQMAAEPPAIAGAVGAPGVPDGELPGQLTLPAPAPDPWKARADELVRQATERAIAQRAAAAALSTEAPAVVLPGDEDCPF